MKRVKSDTMTASQFNQWLEDMRKRNIALTDTQCAQMIGISRRTMLRYKEEGAGLTVALACKNVLFSLGSYQ